MYWEGDNEWNDIEIIDGNEEKIVEFRRFLINLEISDWIWKDVI